MNKTRFGYLLIAGLLLSNLILAAFLLWPVHRPHQGPKNKIIEILQLDEAQVKAYEGLIQQHRQQVVDQERQIRQVKQQLYAQLKTTPDSRLVDSLSHEVGRLQETIEHIHFAHFQDIKGICRPDQAAYYDQLTLELAQLFSRSPKPRQ